MRCAAIADRIVVVEGPARGDGVQAEKAGLLELADAVIVNKSDLDGAEKHAEELIESFHLGLGDAPPVLLTSALNGDGITAVSSTLLDLKDSGRSNRARWRERLPRCISSAIAESPRKFPSVSKPAWRPVSAKVFFCINSRPSSFPDVK